MNGLCVVEVVVLDDLSEGGCVCHLSAQILITEIVMEILMKKENVMSNAVQVRNSLVNTTYNIRVNFVNFTEKPYWGSWGQWSVCSKTCGGGVSIRKRQCYQSKCPHSIYKKCTGNDYEEMKCNDRCCRG